MDFEIDFSKLSVKSSDFKYKTKNWESETFTKSNGIIKQDLSILPMIKEKMNELGYEYDI